MVKNYDYEAAVAAFEGEGGAAYIEQVNSEPRIAHISKGLIDEVSLALQQSGSIDQYAIETFENEGGPAL